MTTPDGPFVPGPPVPNLPKADPDAMESNANRKYSPELKPDEQQRYARGNFNPNVRLDPSIAAVQPGGSLPGLPDHYQTGFDLGRAIVQHTVSQVVDEIESWFR